MKQKPQKSREETAAESHFTVSEDNLKNTTEKQVKENFSKYEFLKYTTEKPVINVIQKAESIEKKYSKPDKRELETIEQDSKQRFNTKKFRTSGHKKKNSKKKSAKTISEKYTPPKKIDLKEEGYELIITEKPQAAMKIANALGKAVQKNINKAPYYEISRDGKKIIVACAVGHLFTLKQNTRDSQVPVFDISWAPNYLARKGDFTKKYYDAILSLIKNAGSLTIATDYDVEGEVIGMNVMKYICSQDDASRMKFSTLTKKELEDSYENKSKHINWNQAIAGETRHFLDWFYGINLSRALMNSIKSVGAFKIMSIGRIQGPTLHLIVQKEKEIQSFSPKPYWQIFITIDNGKNKIELKHNKDIFDSKELSKFENLIGKESVAETNKKENNLPPNSPFNLTSLQVEAYKLYGISPVKTLQIAQSLYLAGLISYPRTSSQKLPESIGYKEIIKYLSEKFNVEKLIKREKPVEGEKTDPAHPSIYPTGQEMELSGDEDKIYKLIAKRFLSLFCEDAIIESKTIITMLNDLKFSVSGQLIRKKSWLEIYPYKIKEDAIPDIDGKVRIIDSKIEQKETQPPKRYSPASIISELEKRNLGTKATRANILETLYDRGYIEGQSIQATPLGISLIKTLEKYSPIIIDEALTRDFEDEMEKIQGADKKEQQNNKQQEIINKAKKNITKIAEDFEKHNKKIGEELVKANIEFREQQKRENILIGCPKCKKGSLIINFSKKNRRFFVSCNAYPDCTNTYSLPPNGIIKKTGKICEKCGWPMLMRLSKGKRPWIFCWNPDCATNVERLKKSEDEI